MSKMTTRQGAKERGALFENELEVIRANLDQQERRLKEQAAALHKQRAEFDLEREVEGKRRDKVDISEILATFRDEILCKVGRFKDEVNANHGRYFASAPSKGQRAYESYRESETAETAHEVPMNPKVSFREATESVPSFDGYNISLTQFVKACRRAKEIVPRSAERNLTKLIINKLRGRAYYAVEDEPCETIT